MYDHNTMLLFTTNTPTPSAGGKNTIIITRYRQHRQFDISVHRKTVVPDRCTIVTMTLIRFELYPLSAIDK